MVQVLVTSLAIRYFDWLDRHSMREMCGGDRIPYTARVVCVPMEQEQ